MATVIRWGIERTNRARFTRPPKSRSTLAMHIAKFTVENYKSFRATPEIRLTPGFNVIVGQNNVGKTALVEALSLRAGSQPHRSLRTMPTRNAPLSGSSRVTIEIHLSRDELLDLLRRVGTLYVPTQ